MPACAIDRLFAPKSFCALTMELSRDDGPPRERGVSGGAARRLTSVAAATSSDGAAPTALTAAATPCTEDAPTNTPAAAAARAPSGCNDAANTTQAPTAASTAETAGSCRSREENVLGWKGLAWLLSRPSPPFGSDLRRDPGPTSPYCLPAPLPHLPTECSHPASFRNVPSQRSESPPPGRHGLDQRHRPRRETAARNPFARCCRRHRFGRACRSMPLSDWCDQQCRTTGKSSLTRRSSPCIAWSGAGTGCSRAASDDQAVRAARKRPGRLRSCRSSRNHAGGTESYRGLRQTRPALLRTTSEHSRHCYACDTPRPWSTASLPSTTTSTTARLSRKPTSTTTWQSITVRRTTASPPSSITSATPSSRTTTNATASLSTTRSSAESQSTTTSTTASNRATTTAGATTSSFQARPQARLRRAAEYEPRRDHVPEDGNEKNHISEHDHRRDRVAAHEEMRSHVTQPSTNTSATKTLSTTTTASVSPRTTEIAVASPSRAQPQPQRSLRALIQTRPKPRGRTQTRPLRRARIQSRQRLRARCLGAREHVRAARSSGDTHASTPVPEGPPDNNALKGRPALHASSFSRPQRTGVGLLGLSSGTQGLQHTAHW